MQSRFAGILLAAAIPAVGAGAMTTAGLGSPSKCEIVEGKKYLGGGIKAQTICSTIETAIAAQAPAASYSVKVRVLSPARLAGALIVNGRALPEHKFAVMDSDLSPAAVQRFAHSLAVAVADAAKR